ncbi:MAG TPA: hypothetical protein VK530_17185 [Candidatus Acidoferrum sp.]|nr:hypothetical protein [Candidatus Acidoferrum sp.]
MTVSAYQKFAKLIRFSPAALGFGVLMLAVEARAQTVNSYLPPELLQRSMQPSRSLLQFGMFDLNPHVGASAVYDNNIMRQEKDTQDDFIFILSPGFDLFKAGEQGAADSMTALRVTYNPALLFFAKHDTNNSVDHYAHLDAGLTLARLSVALSQDFEASSGGAVDVGTRVNQRYYRTGARVRYEISEKTSAEISGSYRITDYEELIDSEEWIEDNSIHYQITPKVSIGFGVSVGQLKVSPTPTVLTNLIATTNAPEGAVQTFITPGLRAAYKTTEKTDVTLAAGGEWRSFEDGSSSFGPVFSLTGTYRPKEGTDLSIEANRREQNSAILGGQNYVATGFGVRVVQRFRERYRASVSYTYYNSVYESAKRDVSTSRVDDYFLMRYGADMIIASSWTLGVFHQYRANTSSSGFDFDNHQINVQTVWSY